MTLLEAIKSNHPFRRPDWSTDIYIKLNPHETELLMRNGEIWCPTVGHIQANDYVPFPDNETQYLITIVEAMKEAVTKSNTLRVIIKSFVCPHNELDQVFEEYRGKQISVDKWDGLETIPLSEDEYNNLIHPISKSKETNGG